MAVYYNEFDPFAASPQPMVGTLRLVIFGPPRTKKSHNNAFIRPGGEKGQPCPHCKKKLLLIVQPSPAYLEWVKTASVIAFSGPAESVVRRVNMGGEKVTYSFLGSNAGHRVNPLTGPMNCAAVFYRDANRGDLFGYLQGLGDFLQEWGIIENDVLIRTVDGSRLLKDAERPRVEVVLSPLDGADDTGAVANREGEGRDKVELLPPLPRDASLPR